VHDAVEHQHVGQRQARVAGAEQLAMAAGQQLIAVVALAAEFALAGGAAGVALCVPRGRYGEHAAKRKRA
jgi:hypothetical protein